MVRQKALHRSSFRQADMVVEDRGVNSAYATAKKLGLDEDQITEIGFKLTDTKYRTVAENNMLVGLQRRLTELKESKVSQRLELKLVKRFGIEKLTK